MTNFTEIFSGAEIDRNRDQFVRELLRELAGVLEDAVGLEEAEGFVAIVGNRIGEAMNNDYTALATTDDLTSIKLREPLLISSAG